MEFWLKQFSEWPPFGQALFIIVLLIILLGAVGSALWAPFKFLLIMIRGYKPEPPVTNVYHNWPSNEEEDEEEEEEEEDEEEVKG